MWFAFGLVTLVVGFLAALHARGSSSWVGQDRMLGTQRYEYGEVKAKGKVVAAYFGVPGGSRFDFALRPESGRDRWFKRIGVSAERQVGDPAFDRAFYLESDDPLVGDVLAKREDVRDALVAATTAIGRRGAKWIALRCRESRVFFHVRPGRDPRPEALARILVPALAALVDALHQSGAYGEVERRDPFIRRAALVLAANTAVALVGAVTLVYAINGSTDILSPWWLFAASLVPGAAMLAVFALCAMRWLGGSSRAHLVLVELLTIGSFGFSMAAYGIAREADMSFDPSPATRRTFEHAWLSTQRGRRNARHFYVTVDGYPAPGDRTRIEVDAATYNRLAKDAPVTLRVRPGLLGFEWLEGVERTPAPG